MNFNFSIAGVPGVLPIEALEAIVVAMVLVLMAAPKVIPELHRLKFGQSIRELGPKSHQVKNGTPTMGGIMIILSLTAVTLLFAPWSVSLGLAIFMILGHFALGFLDDYIKVVRKNNLGLKKMQKFIGQLVMLGLVAAFGNLPTDLWVPFLGNIDLGAAFYVLLFFVMVGTTNAVNLTDGLDGLASGTMIVASAAYMIVCAMLGRQDMAILCGATIGACLGFLKFNYHPAKIFMGDTGSLALGGVMAALGILTHTEILLAVIGFVFVMEAVSVMLQVASFRTTGKRIFRMAPIHHHFELGGWSEVQVVWRFWGVGAIAGILGILLFVLGK